MLLLKIWQHFNYTMRSSACASKALGHLRHSIKISCKPTNQVIIDYFGSRCVLLCVLYDFTVNHYDTSRYFARAYVNCPFDFQWPISLIVSTVKLSFKNSTTLLFLEECVTILNVFLKFTGITDDLSLLPQAKNGLASVLYFNLTFKLHFLVRSKGQKSFCDLSKQPSL